MEVECTMSNECLVVRVVESRIDASGAIAFKERLRDVTAACSKRIILDLSDVVFIDSSGLGAIVSVHKFLGGARLELASLAPAVKKVFQLTHMDRIFSIHADIPHAVQCAS